MNLDDLKKHWNTFAKTDPYWAILTDPSKKDGKWDIEEFFQTGTEHIKSIIAYIESLNLKLQKGSALDFGCGAGRLTQALCPFFAQCSGVDIAPAMIDLARTLNRYGEKCSYHVNTKSDLSLFSSNYFDFIYTWLVLQHIEPSYVKEYLKEFLRVLKPGGLLIFQLPSRRKEPNTPVRHASEINNDTLPAPLPNSGFKAKITVPASQFIFDAGSEVTLILKIQNTSTVVWPFSASEQYLLQIGNHWIDRNGSILLFDDGRTPLPYAVKPSQEIDLPIKFRVPIKEGTYTLEFDMVQEHVSWFHDRGSETVKVPVQVRKSQSKAALSPHTNVATAKESPAHAQDEQAEVAIPVIEMHGIPQDEIIALIETNGGNVIDIQDDVTAGTDWESYRYCVLK